MQAMPLGACVNVIGLFK